MSYVFETSKKGKYRIYVTFTEEGMGVHRVQLLNTCLSTIPSMCILYMCANASAHLYVKLSLVAIPTSPFSFCCTYDMVGR